MNQKRAKKLRKRLRAELSENVPPAVEKPIKPIPSRLLMRRKDALSQKNAPRYGVSPGAMIHQGGAILHPLSDRAMYQFAKKKKLGE